MDDDSPDSTRQPPVQSNGRSPGENGSDPDDGHPSRPPEAGYVGPIYSTRVKVAVAVIGLLAVAAMSWVYMSTADSDGAATSTSGEIAQGIRNVRPADRSQVPRGTTVGVDLTAGWDGRLTINGTPVPETDLTRSARAPADDDSDADDGAGADPNAADGDNGPTRREVVPQLEFAPGPDRIYEELPSGNVCVEAEVWSLASGPDGERHTYEWCFATF